MRAMRENDSWAFKGNRFRAGEECTGVHCTHLSPLQGANNGADHHGTGEHAATIESKSMSVKEKYEGTTFAPCQSHNRRIGNVSEILGLDSKKTTL